MKQGKHIDEYGITYYYKDDKLHRDNDLPAEVWPNRGKVWFQNGLKHRDGDLPAEEWVCETKFWFKNGKLHRLAGPAVTYSNKVECYYINDKELTKEEHANHPEVKKYKLQQVLDRILKETT
jgi:hypothetical protein